MPKVIMVTLDRFNVTLLITSIHLLDPKLLNSSINLEGVSKKKSIKWEAGGQSKNLQESL